MLVYMDSMLKRAVTEVGSGANTRGLFFVKSTAKLYIKMYIHELDWQKSTCTQNSPQAKDPLYLQIVLTFYINTTHKTKVTAHA
jgi:hypothetical protein